MRDVALGVLDFLIRPLRAAGQALEKVEMLVVSAIAGILVVSTGWGVFSRYVLDRPLPWPEEFGVFVYIWLSMVGAAVLMRRRRHIEIAFFYERMPLAVSRLVDLATYALALFFVVILVRASLDVMPNQHTLEFGAALRWPKSFLTLALVVAGVSMALTAVQFILQDLRDLIDPPPDAPDTASGPADI
jgi:TRAP-type C4-dicarboxylate transport system permease small subunit